MFRNYPMKSKKKKASEKTKANHYQKLKSDYAKVELAIQQNAGDLMRNFPIIIALAPGIIDESKKQVICVDIFTGAGNISKIPKRLKVVFPKNKYGYVRTEIIKSKLTGKSHAGPIRSGTIIFNKFKAGTFGTLGCILKGSTANKRYFATCNHVLTDDKFENVFHPTDIVTTKSNGISTDIAKWFFGKMDEQIDLAVCEILPQQIPIIINDDLHYDEADLDPAKLLSSEIEIFGKGRSLHTGFAVNPKINFQIKYANQLVLLKDMILLSKSRSVNNYKTLTQKGDSGAIVFLKESHSIIGIVVGGDSQFTCVLPFKRIQNELIRLKINI